MDESAFASRLISALPEELWAEVSRRLHSHPALMRSVLELDAIDRFLRPDSDLSQWRVGRLGLAVLASRTPAAKGEAERWLLTSEEGKSRVANALGMLREGSEELDLVQSTIAATGLREWRDRDGGWSAVAHESLPDSARWQLPLACLFGLIDNPASLIRALLYTETEVETGAALAAGVLLSNLTAAETATLIQTLPGGLRRAQSLALANGFIGFGAEDLAALVSREAAAEDALAGKTLHSLTVLSEPQDLPLLVRQTMEEIDQALVRRWAGDLAEAKHGLASASQSLRRLVNRVSMALGQVAGEAGDHVTALAAYQTAIREAGPVAEQAALEGLRAQALIALGRHAEALAALEALPEPPALAMASAQHALGQAGEARQWAERAAQDAPAAAPHPSVIAYHSALARLLGEMRETEMALEAQKQVVACRPWDGESQAQLAEMSWETRRYEAAHSAALQALALGPQGPRFAARKIVARYLSQRGKHEAAVEHWKAAKAYAPDDAAVALALADSALQAGQLALATEAAQATLDQSSSAKALPSRIQAEAHRVLGEVASAQGDPDAALEQFEQALSLEPTLSTPWLAIAGQRRKAGDLSGALEVLAKAEQASPQSAGIMVELGQVYDDLGRSTDAINALARACELAPDEGRHQQGLGLLLFRHRYLQGAIGAFRQAVKLVPEDSVSLHHLALSLVSEEGPSEEAYAILQKAASLEPEGADPYRDLGRLALRLDHIQDAQTALLTAIQRQGQPADSDTLALLGEAYEAAGDHLAALDAYRQAISLSPTRGDLNLRIGVCCLAAGQIEAAVAALTEAVETDGASVVAHRELGRAYAAAGMWSEAAMAFEYAATLAPEDAELHRLHGRASLQMAKSPGTDAAHWNNRAVAALTQATDLSAERPEAGMLAELGLALSSVGRLDDARQAYDAALVLTPNSAGIRQEIAGLMTSFGEHARACDLLAEAAAIAPEDLHIAHSWAQSCLAAGRLEDGHKAFMRAAELATTKGTGKAFDVKRAGFLHQAGECLWSLGRRTEAIALWQKALEIDPGDTATRARLGTALLHQGRPGDALAHLEQVVDTAGLEVLLDAARAALGAASYDRAVIFIEKALSIAPDQAEIHYLHGQALAALSQRAEALEEFRRAASLDARQGLYPAAIARALAAQGDTVEAVSAAEMALSLGADQPEVLAAAGEVFLAVEDYARAADVLRRAADAHPTQAQVWLDLARALTLMVEADAPRAEAGMPTGEPEAAHSSRSFATRDLLNQALHKAAVHGASPNTVREWTGRARAFIGDAKEAIVLLESVAASTNTLPPERRAELLRALGHAYRRDGACDRARTVLESAVATSRQSDSAAKTKRLNPTAKVYPDALLELGQTALALGDPAAALNAGRRAAAASPRNPVLLHFLAEALLEMGDRREAAAAFERALALEPNVALWHAQLAKALRAPTATPEDAAAALEHLRAAAELDPHDAHHALELARVLAENGDLLSAANEYRRATDLSPDLADAWREWGHLALKIGGLEMADECFSKALSLTPADTGALVGSAQAALALGHLGEAQAKSYAALRLSPGDPAALACAAEVCSTRGDTAGALEANAKAIAVAAAPADAVRLRLARARYFRAAGRLDEAVKTLEQLATDEPDSDETYGMLGDALMVTKRFDEAMEQYRQALALAPDNATHLLRLGRACLEAGQLDQALAHLLQAREVVADPAEAADVEREVGKTYEARRQIDRALDAYQEAIKLNPNQAENFFRAAMAHKLLRQFHEARQLLQRVVELDSSNVEAHRQLVQVEAFVLLYGAKLATGMVQRV